MNDLCVDIGYKSINHFGKHDNRRIFVLFDDVDVIAA